MENIFIEETKYTPEIRSDIDNLTFSIVGKSYPENTFEFYEPVIKWIEEFVAANREKELVFNFEITYFNSSSSKALFDLFDFFEESNEEGSNIIINWIFDEENESMEEAGEDFVEDFETLKINLVKK